MISVKNHSKNEVLAEIGKYQSGSFVDLCKLRDDFLGVMEHSCEECPEITFQLAVRYLTKDNSDEVVHVDTFSSLFSNRVCTTISNFLSSKQYDCQNKKETKKYKDPYLHK